MHACVCVCACVYVYVIVYVCISVHACESACVGKGCRYVCARWRERERENIGERGREKDGGGECTWYMSVSVVLRFT